MTSLKKQREMIRNSFGNYTPTELQIIIFSCIFHHVRAIEKEYKLLTHSPEATKSIYAHELNEIRKNSKFKKVTRKIFSFTYFFFISQLNV